MKILFDQGTPAPLRQILRPHEVVTAYELGWATLKNGELLDAPERDDFFLFITTDTNLKYQQNLKSRRIAIVALNTTSWPRIKNAWQEVINAVESSRPGTYLEVRIP